MKYLGKTYPGVEAYCFKRKEIRAFRLDKDFGDQGER